MVTGVGLSLEKYVHKIVARLVKVANSVYSSALSTYLNCCRLRECLERPAVNNARNHYDPLVFVVQVVHNASKRWKHVLNMYL